MGEEKLGVRLQVAPVRDAELPRRSSLTKRLREIANHHLTAEMFRVSLGLKIQLQE